MSLSELAAAICPNVFGSSTIGVKKSTVCTSAISSPSLYTPASSLVSNPTSTLGSLARGKPRKTESSKLGLSFAAQPAALTIAVSFTVCVKPHLCFPGQASACPYRASIIARLSALRLQLDHFTVRKQWTDRLPLLLPYCSQPPTLLRPSFADSGGPPIHLNAMARP